MGKIGTLAGRRYRRGIMALQRIPLIENLSYLEIFAASWRFRSQGRHPIADLLTSVKRRELDGDERAAVEKIERIKDEAQRLDKDIKIMSIPKPWGVFLLKLVRHLRPEVSLEMGTAFGVSSMYQSAALKINGSGILYTLDGSKSRTAVARRNLEKFGSSSVRLVFGFFEQTLIPTLDALGKLDFAFLDGNHEKEATLKHFSIVSGYAKRGAVILLDDIRWSTGMWDAWQTVSNSDRVSSSVDLQRMGLCTIA